MGSVYGPNLVTDGLVAYLDAGNAQSYPGSGSTWYDIVGTSDGAITNATYSSTDGGVIVYDGSGDYVIMDASDPKVFANNTDITMEIWAAKDQDNSNTSPFLFQYNSQSNYPMIAMIAYGTSGNYNDYGCFLETSTDQDGDGSTIGNTTLGTRSHTPDPNGWAQHVMTYTGSSGSHTLALYMDTALQGTVNSSGSHIWYKPTNPKNGGITLASNSNVPGGTTHSFEGKMSIVKIYNKALTTAEILQNYNAHKSRFGL